MIRLCACQVLSSFLLIRVFILCFYSSFVVDTLSFAKK